MIAPNTPLASAWERFDASFLADEARRAEINTLRSEWKRLHYAMTDASADEAKALSERMAVIEGELVSLRLDAVEVVEEFAAEFV